MPADVTLVGGIWLLLVGSVDARPVPMPDETRTTIAFTGDGFGGHAACNRYGGDMESAGNVVSLGQVVQTHIGCAGELLDSEQTFIASLRRVTAIWLDGEELVLTGHGVELRFVRLPEVQTDQFVDRQWVLAALVNDGEMVAPGGAQATLLMGTDGTFSGSTGCRTFRGMWIASGDQIFDTAIDMSFEQCPEPLQIQDGLVVSVIGGAIPTVDGDELTLRAVNGDALIYRLGAE